MGLTKAGPRAVFQGRAQEGGQDSRTPASGAPPTFPPLGKALTPVPPVTPCPAGATGPLLQQTRALRGWGGGGHQGEGVPCPLRAHNVDVLGQRHGQQVVPEGVAGHTGGALGAQRGHLVQLPGAQKPAQRGQQGQAWTAGQDSGINPEHGAQNGTWHQMPFTDPPLQEEGEGGSAGGPHRPGRRARTEVSRSQPRRSRGGGGLLRAGGARAGGRGRRGRGALQPCPLHSGERPGQQASHCGSGGQVPKELGQEKGPVGTAKSEGCWVPTSPTALEDTLALGAPVKTAGQRGTDGLGTALNRPCTGCAASTL